MGKKLLPSLAVLAATLFSCLCCSVPRAALSFSPDQLAEAQVGLPYTATITISNNETPVGNMWIDDGRLPAGLEFRHAGDDSIAHIVGTPQEAGTFRFTVYAWCLGTNVNGQQGQRQYEIVVR